LLRMHQIVLNTKHDPRTVLNRDEVQRTRLLEFFRMCAVDGNARRFTYQEFSQHYVWRKQEKIWKIRERCFAIGRLYFASPAENEHFYLQLLLIVVVGSCLIEDLQTVDGVMYGTFKDACNAMDLYKTMESGFNAWKKWLLYEVMNRCILAQFICVYTL
jgi:hypothetical protein